MGRQALLHINSQYQQIRQKLFSPLASLGRLALLFAVALFVTCLLATGNATAEMLFQSPPSPPAQPLPTQPPAEQPPTEQPPAEQPPAEQPPAEQPPTEQPPVEQPPAEQPSPAEQPPAEQPSPAEQATIESVSPLQPSTSQTPLPPQEPLPAAPERGGGELSLEDEQTSNFILDRAELIDTLVVSGAYVWLCCGVILFLLIPLSLLLLFIRGRSKIIQEEGP